MDSRREDNDLDAEIQSHLQMAARDKLAVGQSPRDARDATLREFGNVGLVKEVTRGIWAGDSLESFLQDIRYGLRTLSKTPGFAAVAILTLALGIGANTAIFSVVNAVVLNPLPYPEPDRIAVLFQDSGNFHKGSISFPNFLDWQRLNRSFTAIAAYRNVGYNLLGQGEPERVHGEMISAGFFEIMGVKPLIGRSFTTDEDQLGANPVAMISERLWRRKFDADPKIIGQRVILDDTGRTVVGVIPSSLHLKIQNFQNYMLNDVYTPIGESREMRLSKRSAGLGTDAIGRLRSGVTWQQAREDMDRVSRELATAYPDFDSNRSINIVPLREEMVGAVRPVLLILLGAVAFVLLIACVNVANLLLARSSSREREFAIRFALGAGQLRVIRQLLTESLLLATSGGLVGLLLATWGTRLALAFVPGTLPRAEEVGMNPPVLLFTLGISILCGITFGLAPAWRSARSNVGSTLKESGRSVAGNRSRAQNAFIVGEMAMALVLLVGAGLMIRSLFYLWSCDPGFSPQNVITFSTAAPESMKTESPAAIRAFYLQMHDTLAATPGVESVSFNTGATPMQSDDESHFWILGTPKPAHYSDLPESITYSVEPDYLQVMRIPLKQGRFFDAHDSERTQPVAAIDEAFAQKHFPGKNPIGQYLDFDTETTGADKQPPVQIVGVVAHVNQWGLADDGAGALQAETYFPYWQTSDKQTAVFARFNTIYLRTRPAGTPDFNTLRRRLLAMDNNLVVYDARPLSAIVNDSIAEKRFSMSLLAVFALLALLLAGIGIYGVLSYLVGQRTQEIGVRMALGAQRSDVLRLIMGDGACMTLLGIGIGIVAALGLTRLMTGMLFGVRPADPLTFAAVTLILASIALFACYVPAHRAMRVDPTVALRYE